MPRTDGTGFGLWHTPNVPNGGRVNPLGMSMTGRLPEGKKRQVGLEHQVRMTEAGLWPTPCAADNRDRGHLGMPAIKRRAEKGKQLNLSMVVSEHSGSLNPTWVEWLMGYPEGWTVLEPSATPSSRKSPK